ncbi:MAG: hypothetical protein WD431_00080 [Cyclobacteriaceae bacterium]
MDFSSLFLILIGCFILVIVVIDIFLTVIHLGGGGIISKPFSAFIWRIFTLYSNKNPESPVLKYAGSVINYFLKMKGNFIKPAMLPPPFQYQQVAGYWDDLDISETNRQKKLDELNDRRCLLLGLIEKDLWQWQDMYRAADLPSDKS